MQSNEAGIAEGTRNACRVEVHVLRPGENRWKIYTGRYYSPTYTPGLLTAFAQAAADLHYKSIFTVRVVMHEVVDGIRQSVIAVHPHSPDRSLSAPEESYSELSMMASDDDRRPKGAPADGRGE